MKNKIINLNLNRVSLFIISITFIFHQFFYILQGGQTWDEILDVYGSGKNIEKFKLFITNQKVEELSDISAEYYGQLIKLPIYLVSKSQFINNLFSKFIQLINLEETLYIESFFNMRHFLLNIYIFISIYLIYFFCKKLTKFPEITLIVLFFIFSNPIFVGQAMFNLTDIPYAIQLFLASLVYIDRIVLNEPTNKDIVFVGLFFGMSLLTRINAAAFLLPLGFYYLFVHYKKLNFLIFLKKHIYILGVSIFVLLLGTPSFYIDPVHYINGAIFSQFQQPWAGSFMMNGNLFFSLDWHPDFLLKLFLFKLPIVVLIFFLIGIVKIKSSTSHLFRYAYFFIAYVYIAHEIFRPAILNYFRHYLFLIPFVSVIAGYVFYDLFFNKTKVVKITSLVIIFGYMIFTQFGLQEYKYVYVNELVDEQKISTDCKELYEFNGCGYWQTDYYGFSGKETINLVEKLSYENVYLCDPTHTYGMYIDNNFWEVKNGNPAFDDYGFWDQYTFIYNIEHLEEYVELNSSGNFYALAIHSPGYTTCNFDRLGINLNKLACNVDSIISRKMRGTTINLNYIHYCEYSI